MSVARLAEAPTKLRQKRQNSVFPTVDRRLAGWDARSGNEIQNAMVRLSEQVLELGTASMLGTSRRV